MLVMLIVFLITTLLIAAGINIFETLSKEERINALKLFAKSAVYSLLSLSILSIIVFLF